VPQLEPLLKEETVVVVMLFPQQVLVVTAIPASMAEMGLQAQRQSFGQAAAVAAAVRLAKPELQVLRGQAA
jgi:hypothetical protein